MCGIFGIISKEPIHDILYQGMLRLQHRGQHAAGAFTYNPKNGKYELKRNLGLVHDVFGSHNPLCDQALWGIGHIRYSTIGSGCIEDTQPMFTAQNNCVVAMAHNGNIVNYVSLKKELQSKLTILETSCDIELILHLFAQHIPKGAIGFDDICSAVMQVYEQTSGAYSVIGLIPGVGMIAFRDPKGIRPLLYGFQPQTQSSAFSSETEPLSFLNFQDIQIIQPGEVVFVDQNHQVYRRQLLTNTHSHCSFEFVYFTKMNTRMEDQEIYRIRSDLGAALAKQVTERQLNPDVVVAVPDTARPAAISLARKLKLPYEEGFIRKPHIGRTFITPTQPGREKAVINKLEAVPYVFKNKSVLIVDDSIVRGTVSKKVVHLARNAGAKKIYFASTFPPIRHPCFYGIDFPDSEQLVAYGKTEEEVAKFINADVVVYNTIKDLKHAIGIKDLCLACLTGEYPIDTKEIEEFQALRVQEITQMETVGP